jgi:hypothetical protein
MSDRGSRPGATACAGPAWSEAISERSDTAVKGLTVALGDAMTQCWKPA